MSAQIKAISALSFLFCPRAKQSPASAPLTHLVCMSFFHDERSLAVVRLPELTLRRGTSLSKRLILVSARPCLRLIPILPLHRIHTLLTRRLRVQAAPSKPFQMHDQSREREPAGRRSRQDGISVRAYTHVL